MPLERKKFDRKPGRLKGLIRMHSISMIHYLQILPRHLGSSDELAVGYACPDLVDPEPDQTLSQPSQTNYRGR